MRMLVCFFFFKDLHFGEVTGAVSVLEGTVDVVVFDPEDVRMKVGYNAALERHRGTNQDRLIAEIFYDDRLHVQTLCSLSSKLCVKHRRCIDYCPIYLSRLLLFGFEFLSFPSAYLIQIFVISFQIFLSCPSH